MLESKAVGSAEVFICGGCHGLWISGYDMASLMRAPYESWKLPWTERAADGSTTVDNTVRCVCSSKPLMNTVMRQGVAIDLCPDCGALWCDGGELEELIRSRGEKELRGPEDALLDGHKAVVGLELVLNLLLGILQPP